MSYSSLSSSKRAAEEYAHTTDKQGQPSKKPRFDLRNPSALAPDAAEDDAILDADVIGARGQQVRRGAVNIDGYDSDSENDNFNSRADAKARDTARQARTQREEDDNDMFADLEEDFRDEDESETERRRKEEDKKKAVRFLDEDEIEGQVKSSKSGGHVSADFTLGGREKGKAPQHVGEVESSSESEVDDATRADIGDIDEELGAGGKKTHAPKLDAFNMREEQEEGRFDDQGNYIRKAADPDAKHDLWLEGTSKKDMKRAKEAAEKREQERRKRDLEEDATSTTEILTRLIPLLDRGETVLEALARLGKAKQKKQKWQTKQKNKKHNGDAYDVADDDPMEQRRRERIEAITAAADLLLSKGHNDIYDTERELLIRQYKRESGDEWIDSADLNDDARDNTLSHTNQQWEYRWTDARDGGAVNGPYDSNTMKQWNDAGYFGEGVEFRRREGGDWSRVAEFA